MSIIECLNLCKVYGRNDIKVEALKQINLSISSCEFVVLEGPSGSGKSTLLQLMGGLDTPTDGRVIVYGQDLFTMNEKARSIFRRLNYGFVFQSFNLLPALTAKDNIMMPLLLGKEKVDMDWFNHIVKILGIEDRLGHLPSQMSGGQQQRVAIARAILNRPKVILADEPTGNLDVKTGKRVLDLLIETSFEAQSALIIVTHDSSIATMAQRCITLIDGEIVKERVS